MMQDPFTAKIVSRDARDFARNRKINKQAHGPIKQNDRYN